MPVLRRRRTSTTWTTLASVLTIALLTSAPAAPANQNPSGETFGEDTSSSSAT